jgi:hypothetical protein
LRSLLIIGFVLVVGAVTAHSQSVLIGSALSPREVVEQLWIEGTRGDLLKPEHWNRASRLFVNPDGSPGDRIVVMSNDWGVDHAKVEGNSATVVVHCSEIGRITSAMRFEAIPRDTGSVGTGLIYHLVLGPTRSIMENPRISKHAMDNR